jgi:hypothetical protein
VPIKPIQAASQTQANRMSSLAKPTLMPSIYQNWAMSQNPSDSPLITKPPVPVAMADKLMASVLFCLPNTTYDLPADDLPLGSA